MIRLEVTTNPRIRARNSLPYFSLAYESPASLSVHMAWVTEMAMVRDCLISARITSFLSPIPGLSTSHPQNHLVLKWKSFKAWSYHRLHSSEHFRSSILDTRVYRSVLHESDHELVVMKVIRHAGGDCRMILFGQLSTPTNDLSFQLSLQCNVRPLWASLGIQLLLY